MNRTALLAVAAILSFTSCSKERRPKEIYHEGMGAHGMPSDWKSTVSKGSLTEGRKLFVELECYKCHAVIDPDAQKLGYVGEDGKSKMPDYNSVMTIKQVADLAAYIASLKGLKPNE